MPDTNKEETLCCLCYHKMHQTDRASFAIIRTTLQELREDSYIMHNTCMMLFDEKVQNAFAECLDILRDRGR